MISRKAGVSALGDIPLSIQLSMLETSTPSFVPDTVRFCLALISVPSH